MTTNSETQLDLGITLPQPRSLYLAGPFFNAEQISAIEKAEFLCEEYGVQCNSPRKFLVLKPRASWEERKLVFKKNLEMIQRSQIVLAMIDGWDTGTVWEMGYAHAIGRPVVTFTAKEGKMNVMLAQGCNGFLRDWEAVEKFLDGVYSGVVGGGDMDWEFNWEVAEAWMEDIF